MNDLTRAQEESQPEHPGPLLAALIITTAIENPNDVCRNSAPPYRHQAVLKFAANTGSQAIHLSVSILILYLV
ncbi:structural constituent of ribosome [Puccinia graminis f. sp. tritici]|uniref:Structural constituent of ribosome n=1 Tax=Puccinia graminis f. sp. tritici TaxID=56615 RepID=A0A5B0R9U8_PUCGR|nr:structural constituent of ribosome [Puccinia graminis f. sp. tritici]